MNGKPTKDQIAWLNELAKERRRKWELHLKNLKPATDNKEPIKVPSK
jgi:hypothetical protein